MKKEIFEALNNQINGEMFSANLYLNMSAYFESLDLSGFAKWMKLQAEEENEHAMKIFKHLQDRGEKPVISAIGSPKSDWSSVLEAFEDAYAHEKKVTNWIHEILTLARDNKDYATDNFLQWFVSEQVEEESIASEIVTRVKFAGDNSAAILFLDSELGSRD